MKVQQQTRGLVTVWLFVAVSLLLAGCASKPVIDVEAEYTINDGFIKYEAYFVNNSDTDLVLDTYCHLKPSLLNRGKDFVGEDEVGVLHMYSFGEIQCLDHSTFQLTVSAGERKRWGYSEVPVNRRVVKHGTDITYILFSTFGYFVSGPESERLVTSPYDTVPETETFFINRIYRLSANERAELYEGGDDLVNCDDPRIRASDCPEEGREPK